MRVTLTISNDADQMLDELAARDMRSRGAVVELLVRAAHSGTPVCADAAQAHTTVAPEYHSTHTGVALDAARSDPLVAPDAREGFYDAMLKLDEMF